MSAETARLLDSGPSLLPFRLAGEGPRKFLGWLASLHCGGKVLPLCRGSESPRVCRSPPVMRWIRILPWPPALPQKPPFASCGHGGARDVVDDASVHKSSLMR